MDSGGGGGGNRIGEGVELEGRLLHRLWRAGARTAQVLNSATAVVDATRACLSPPRASGKLEGNSDTKHSNEVRLELGPIQVLHDRHLDRGLENQAVRHELHTG